MSERTTTNRIWAGIAAGVLTTAALAFVGIGAYRAGQRSDVTVEVVRDRVDEGGDAARTIVVDGGWHDGWRGPGPGIVLFPLLVIGVIAFVASRRGPRRGWGGPGPWTHDLDDWHRRAHGGDPHLVTSGAPPLTDPTVPDPPPPTPTPPSGS